MAPIILKIKGNKSFSPFSNLDSEEELSKTWRVCTKVKDSLENGSRLENLSWRLWFLHHLLVEDSKGKTHFKKLSMATTKKLEGEKGTALSQLPAPKSFNFANSAIPIKKDQQPQQQAKKSKKKSHKKPTVNVATEVDSSKTEPVVHNAPVPAKPSNDVKNEHTMVLHDVMEVDNSPLPSPDSNSSSPLSNEEQDYHTYQNQQNTQPFVLHQYTSDQADDQVIELEDIFGAFSSMQAFLSMDPNQPPVIQIPYDDMMGSDWEQFSSPMSSRAPSPTYNTQLPENNSTNDNPYFYNNNMLYNELTPRTQSPPTLGNTVSAGHMTPSMAAQPMIHSVPTSPVSSSSLSHALQASIPPSRPTMNNRSMSQLPAQSINTTNAPSVQSAMYVTATMPPPPVGTLNKLLASLPPQTLNSAERILTPTNGGSSHAQSGRLMYVDSSNSNSNSIYPTSLSVPSSPVSTVPPMLSRNGVPMSISQSIAYTQHDGVSVKQEERAMKSGGMNDDGENEPRTESKSICTNCGATSTPLWRRSANDELLCNACGLYLKLHNAPRPKSLKPHIVRKDARGEDEAIQPICSNCGTTTTPLWRRDEDGAPLCNACGLYLKLHHEKRPMSMKTDIIKKRQRYENGQNPGRRPSKKARVDGEDVEPQQLYLGSTSGGLSSGMSSGISTPAQSPPPMDRSNALDHLGNVPSPLDTSFSL
ncbi:hypothetical protein BC936DRAFT_145054 [Jimgerdemannia flammicorona]|uniref:GATA-type domain-containing protein n=1 Tax=Jimgerdemannia flammicorona TaxID=994334 RepID=A0A433DB18_9FUNG|nr:hypothetical protein BC936DRAFT_145054 [Jimgerdemannia flammicorona]